MARFENGQWAVTEDGMESVGDVPEYGFEAGSLSQTITRSDATFYDWPVHMADMSWVDVDAFNEAFARAMDIHVGRYLPPLDRRMLARSLAEARRVAAARG